MIKCLAFLLTLFTYYNVLSQNDTLRVLFLGNSYTNYNNLPVLTQNLASGINKTLIVDSNTPGGYTLQGHATNASSQAKIALGNWDFVVLQEQSQIPTIDFYRYGSMNPACFQLNDSIKKYNPCAKVVLYMTWGRRYGGQQCDFGNVNCSPVFRDFNHMQDSLEQAYLAAADSIDALVAPVGVAWKNLLNDTALVLHTSDNSHPSYMGSYLAASVFHQVFWRQASIHSTFQGSLSGAVSQYCKQIADTTVFNSITRWNLDRHSIHLSYTVAVQGNSVILTNQSINSFQPSWLWLFGDGDFSTSPSPTHRYRSPGTYTLSLIGEYCNERDTLQQTVFVGTTSLKEHSSSALQVFPNPFTDQVGIKWNSYQNNATLLKIFDASGACLASIPLRKTGAEKQTMVDLGEYAKGVYFLQIIGAEGESRRIKVIKQ